MKKNYLHYLRSMQDKANGDLQALQNRLNQEFPLYHPLTPAQKRSLNVKLLDIECAFVHIRGEIDCQPKRGF